MAARSHRYRVTVEHVGTPHEGEALQPPLSFEAGNHDEILGIARRATERLNLSADEGAQLMIGLRLLNEFLLLHRKDPLFGGMRDAMSPFTSELRQRNAPPPEPKAS